MPSLVEVKNGVDGARHELAELLDREIVQIGREKCQILCPNPAVSRQHCELYRKGDGIVVHDLGSAVGTFVNGVRLVSERMLRGGDILVLADVTFRFEDEGATGNYTYIVDNSVKAEKAVHNAGGRVERQIYVPQADFDRLKAETRELQAQVAGARQASKWLGIGLAIALVLAMIALAAALRALLILG